MNRKKSERSSASKQRANRPRQAQQTGGPQQIGNAIAELMARRGYGQVEWREEAWQAWQAAVGEHLANMCRVGAIRRGVIEITVASSSVLQELTFRKLEILRKIQHGLPAAKIRDVRFRVGEVGIH